MNRTRVVRWLRVLLPLAALAMLSTLFLFSREPEAVSRIPYADVDAETMARDPRLVAPDYAGVTEDGVRLTLRASSASVPGAGASGDAQDLRLDWQRPDGLTAELTAPEGGLADGQVRLSGGVRMQTSSGWEIVSPRIEAATDRSRIEAAEGVEAAAPFGALSAGRMRLAPAEDAGAGGAGTGGAESGGPAVLDFSGGVRLIYQP